ncbi:hypothetical protein [Streptomyces sp. NPDC048527]|uniref:hypothetical protein n=1 Tax=Streptomyces sp. NPDC048527 TaxID=3365568 RepID=UPI00371E2D2D
MTDRALALNATATQATTTGPAVWILTTGELYEGGTVQGVYATKDLAKDDFLTAVQRIPFAIDKAWVDDDQAVHVEGGCDFVDLVPHTVTVRRELTCPPTAPAHPLQGRGGLFPSTGNTPLNRRARA